MKIYYRGGQFQVAQYNSDSGRVELVSSADTLDGACAIAGIPSVDDEIELMVDEGTEEDLLSLIEN